MVMVVHLGSLAHFASLYKLFHTVLFLSLSLSPSPLRLAAGKVLSSANQLGPDQHAEGRADREQEGL